MAKFLQKLTPNDESDSDAAKLQKPVTPLLRYEKSAMVTITWRPQEDLVSGATEYNA
jgi:hypothetical protein